MLSVDVVEDACREAEAVTAMLRRDPAAVPAARLLVVAGIWLDLAGAAFGAGTVGESLVDMAGEVSEMVAGLQH